MSHCTHCQWIDISQRDVDFIISSVARFEHVLREVPNPNIQFPSISYFIGKKAKVSALQALFPENNITRRQAHGIGNLHMDSNTSSSCYPMLFADCTPGAECINQVGLWTGYHELKQFRLGSWVTRSIAKSSLIDQLQAQLLFLFTNVICIFADDVDPATGELIKKWIEIPSLVQTGPKPRLLIVSQVSRKGFELDDILSSEGSPSFQTHFASIKHIYLFQPSQLSTLTIYQSLREGVLRELDSSRHSRLAQGRLFSAAHLNAFFEAAIEHFVRGHKYTFSFTEVARSGNFIESDFKDHIRHFLNLASQGDVRQVDVAYYLAHVVTLDSYPPNSHSKYVFHA